MSEEIEKQPQTAVDTSKEGAKPFKAFKDESELDSFVDKRVSKALETAKSKWEQDAQDRENKAGEDD